MIAAITPTLVDLSAVSFARHEAPLATHGDIAVSTLRYASGVAALRVRTRVGEVVLLPFHGQQIWDAHFHGRRLTMGSSFGDPQNVTAYLENYGGFLLHCGVTAMGNPTPEDTHPLHGELPNATYQQAHLLFGEEAGQRYVGLSGVHEHLAAFGAHYTFKPSLRIFEASGRMTLGLSIANLRSKPMDFMYLAHINFRPVDGATIRDAIPDDPKSLRVRRRLPEFFRPDAAYSELIAAIAAEPGGHRRVEPGRRIDPELVIALDCVAGADGWSHAMQRLPDGAADFVSHRPLELDHAVRWMTRNGDEDALGVVLPATAEADGYLSEKAKGNVKQLAPGGEFTCRLEFGALTATEAAEMAVAIEAARAPL